MKLKSTDEHEAWLSTLDVRERKQVVQAIRKLELMGVELPFPHSSAVEGAAFPLRELRVAAGHSPLRVIYAFDPRRDAVLLLGGDKSGDPRFYERISRRVEQIWRDYLLDLEQEEGM